MNHQIEIPAFVVDNVFECWKCCKMFFGRPYEPPEDFLDSPHMRGTLCDACGAQIERKLRAEKLKEDDEK